MRWRHERGSSKDWSVKIIESSNSNHVDWDSHISVRSGLGEDRGELDVPVGEVLVEYQRVEDHGAQEHDLVVLVAFVGTTICTSLVAVTFQAQVGLDKVTRGGEPVVPVVDHEGLDILQEARWEVLLGGDEGVVVGGLVPLHADKVTRVDRRARSSTWPIALGILIKF